MILRALIIVALSAPWVCLQTSLYIGIFGRKWKYQKYKSKQLHLLLVVPSGHHSIPFLSSSFIPITPSLRLNHNHWGREYVADLSWIPGITWSFSLFRSGVRWGDDPDTRVRSSPRAPSDVTLTSPLTSSNLIYLIIFLSWAIPNSTHCWLLTPLLRVIPSRGRGNIWGTGVVQDYHEQGKCPICVTITLAHRHHILVKCSRQTYCKIVFSLENPCLQLPCDSSLLWPLFLPI